MQKTQVRPETYAYVSDALERNVIVEIVTTAGPASGLLVLGRDACAPARAGGPTRAGTSTRRRAGDRRAGRPAAPAPEHLQVVTDDLGRVAIVALLVLPFAGAQASLDVDLRALAQVLAGDLRQAPEERHAVPFGALLLLTGLLVAPAFAGRDAQVRHGRAGGHGASLGVGPQVAYENDLVDATRHGESLKRGRETGFGSGARRGGAHSRGRAPAARTSNPAINPKFGSEWRARVPLTVQCSRFACAERAPTTSRT